MNGCVTSHLCTCLFLRFYLAVLVVFIVCVCKTSAPFSLSLARGGGSPVDGLRLSVPGLEDRGCEGWSGVTSEGEDSSNA